MNCRVFSARSAEPYPMLKGAVALSSLSQDPNAATLSGQRRWLDSSPAAISQSKASSCLRSVRKTRRLVA